MNREWERGAAMAMPEVTFSGELHYAKLRL